MADKEQTKEQLKGGDHIPTDTTEQEQKDTGSGGLLSKIGDPVGMFFSLFTISALRCHPLLIPSPPATYTNMS